MKTNKIFTLLREVFLRKESAVVILVLCIVTVLFRDFVTTGKPVFPGNFMQAWHEPWRTENYINDKIMLPNKPVADDVFRHIVPFRMLGVDLMSRFQLPLWNPYNGSGMPLMATINSGFLDPFTVLYAVFATETAHGMYLYIQAVMIALAMFLYGRSLKLSVSAAFFASIVYLLSGFVVVRLVFVVYGFAIALLPICLYIVERLRQDKKTRARFLIPFVIFCLIVSTQTQVALYILITTFTYALFRLRDEEGVLQKISLGKLIVFSALGMGLASVQLFPTYELMKLSHISTGSSAEIIDTFLVPFQHLISILIPNFFGNTATYNYWGYGDYPQTVAYMGILPVFLMLVSIWMWKKKTFTLGRFFIVFTIVTILLGFDWLGSRLFYQLPIPVLSTGAPARIFFLSTFGLSILSGIGIEHMLSGSVSKRRIILSCVAVSVPVALLLIVTYILNRQGVACRPGIYDACFTVGFRNTVFATGVFGVQMILIGVLVLRRRRVMRRVVIIGLFMSMVGVGMYNAWKFFPHTPTKELFPSRPVIEALQTHTSISRVFGVGEANLPTNLATHWRIYDPEHYHPLYIERYRVFLEYANNGHFVDTFPRGDASIRHFYDVDEELKQDRERLLNLTSTQYRLFKTDEAESTPAGRLAWSDEDWILVATDSALPRAHLVMHTEVKTDSEEMLDRLYDPAFDIYRSAVVEEEVGLEDTSPPGISYYSVNIDQYSEHSVDISVNTPSDSLLMLTDNYYPGWNAYLDGEQVKVYRTNFIYRGVKVPPGFHQIEFRYEPRSVRIGAIVSVSSLIVLVLLFGRSISLSDVVIRRRRRRRSR